MSAGVLSVATDSNLGDATGGLTLDGGELLATGNNFTTNRTITLTANGGTLAKIGSEADFNGNIVVPVP